VNKVLLTGATGFVGSTLAAIFLARSMPVVVLSRNDPDGERTESAILEAARGFGFDISQAITHNLDIINVDFSDLEYCIAPDVLADVKIAWHCAADMSYSPNKLATSFETNVGNTTRLFRILHNASPDFRRFYYVSTAYVAGMRGGRVTESLHPWGRLINPCQITKWGAEQALHLLHLTTNVPITIFRPSVIVGHRRSGWVSRNGFGFYMFIDALRAFSAAGYEHITVDMNAGIRPDLIAIDQLAEEAATLALQDAQRRPFEVFHCTGGLGSTTHELISRIACATGTQVSFGNPVTAIEQKFDRATELHKPFANIEWEFERNLLDQALGRKESSKALTPSELSRMIAWYLDQDIYAVMQNSTQSALAN